MSDSREVISSTITGFFHEVGAELELYSAEKVVIALNLEDRHMNNASTLHGGVLATLADVAMAMVGTYVDDPLQRHVAITLSMSLNFTKSATAGTRIRAVANCRSAGHKIFMSSCEILDAQDRLLAFANGVFKRGALRSTLP